MHKKRIRTGRRVEPVLQGGSPLRRQMIEVMQERKLPPFIDFPEKFTDHCKNDPRNGIYLSGTWALRVRTADCRLQRSEG